jgi:hypothetical protein
MKKQFLFLAFFLSFVASYAQVENAIPQYNFNGQLGAGMSGVMDANTIAQFGKFGGENRGVLFPRIADTASITGTKRNGLLIYSIQKSAYSYWDSTGARWVSLLFQLSSGGTFYGHEYGIAIGSDMTSALNSLFSNSSVRDVVLNQGDITVNGTLNIPAGKTLVLKSPARIVGTGTLNFASASYLNADGKRTIFVSSLSVTNLQTVDGRAYVEWWGAVGDGATDDTSPINRAVAATSDNEKVRLYFRGVTYLTAGIVSSNKTSLLFYFEGTRIKTKYTGSVLTTCPNLFTNIQKLSLQGSLILDGNYTGGVRFDVAAVNYQFDWAVIGIIPPSSRIIGSYFELGSLSFSDVPLAGIAMTAAGLTDGDGYDYIKIDEITCVSGTRLQAPYVWGKAIAIAFFYVPNAITTVNRLYSSDPLGYAYQQGTLTTGGSGVLKSCGNWSFISDVSKPMKSLYVKDVISDYDVATTIGPVFRGVDDYRVDNVVITNWWRRPGASDSYYTMSGTLAGLIWGKFAEQDIPEGTPSMNSRSCVIHSLIVKGVNPNLFTFMPGEVYATQFSTGARKVRIDYIETEANVTAFTNYETSYHTSTASIGTLVSTSNTMNKLDGCVVDRLIFLKGGSFGAESNFTAKYVEQQSNDLLFFEVGANYFNSRFVKPSGSNYPLPTPNWTTIENAKFRNASMRVRVEENGVSYPFTTRDFACRLRLKNVSGLTLLLFPILNGTVQWNNTDWTSTVETRWQALRDFYEFDFENVDFINSSSTAESNNSFFFPLSLGQSGGNRQRIFDQKNLATTASWVYPLKQNKFVNCTMQSGSYVFPFNNTTEIKTLTVSELKTKISPFGRYYISDAGKRGFFTQDTSDFSTAGDDINIIVAPYGERMKRDTVNVYASGGGGSGAVTSVSVTSANGFAGTVATATTTPAISISTTVNGIAKGNGTGFSAAVAGTDYQIPIILTTTGTSGAATFSSGTLNIPNYTYTPSSNVVNAKTTITTGTSSTVPANTRRVYFDPSTLLSTFTLTLPAAPSDGDEILISFGGTIASGATVVTSLTVSANAGQGLIQYVTPLTAKGGDNILYHFNASNSKWYREL